MANYRTFLLKFYFGILYRDLDDLEYRRLPDHEKEKNKRKNRHGLPSYPIQPTFDFKLIY